MPDSQSPPSSAAEREPFKITIRHVLFPLVLWLYRREPMATRGSYLHSFKFEKEGERLVRIFYGRFDGFRYGTLTYSVEAPHVVVERKDGLKVAHSFHDDPASRIELTAEGILSLHRSNEPVLQICNIRQFHMLQIVWMHHNLPAKFKDRLKVKETRFGS